MPVLLDTETGIESWESEDRDRSHKWSKGRGPSAYIHTCTDTHTQRDTSVIDVFV